jgi:hypothetical protein
MRDPGSIPRGVLLWNQDSPVSLHWWPDVIDHFCGLVWIGLRPELSLGRCADNVIIPLDLTQLFCSGFTLAAGPPSSFTTNNRHSWLLEGSPVESLQSHCIHTMSHWSSGLPICFPSWCTRVQSPGGYFCETRILLFVFVLYRYNSVILSERYHAHMKTSTYTLPTTLSKCLRVKTR